MLGHWRAAVCAIGCATGGVRPRRMTPVGCAAQEFRMQFTQYYVVPHMHIVGIATFADIIESSLNRIACETAPR